jgi:hypothetical protein
MAWQRPAAPVVGLTLASDAPLSWAPGLGAAEGQSTTLARRGTEPPQGWRRHRGWRRRRAKVGRATGHGGGGTAE